MNIDIDSCLIEAIKEMNIRREHKIPLDDPGSLVLYGESGVFDSLELVNYLMLVEEHLTDALGVNLSLTSERAISLRNSPFRSVSALKEFIREELEITAKVITVECAS